MVLKNACALDESSPSIGRIKMCGPSGTQHNGSGLYNSPIIAIEPEKGLNTTSTLILAKEWNF